MQIQNLDEIEDGTPLTADLVIIGSGPVGLTIARELFGSDLSVLVLESGVLEEAKPFNALLEVESTADPKGEATILRRKAFHGSGAKLWTQEAQGYGLRCRVMGGSSHAWAGKSALFDDIDFTKRSWIENSGWPINREALIPYFDRAAAHLNLGPNRYDDTLFQILNLPAPLQKGSGQMRSFFWQFARSRRDKMDMMRFGPDFAVEADQNVRVLLNATVTDVAISDTGSAFESLEISTLSGRKFKLFAKSCVLAMGAIENARLLLASRRQHAEGLGNKAGNVGRYLMDHPSVTIARVPEKSAKSVLKLFSFYGVSSGKQVHMYQHGLAPTADQQRERGLVNCAAYVLEQRALDDPWDAIKRLVRRQSKNAVGDVVSVLTSPGLLIKGVGMKLLSSPKMPEAIKGAIINTVLKLSPGTAVSEFQDRGLPHKLTGLEVDAIVEQPPKRDNRVTLSDRADALGMPLARITWTIGDEARRALLALAKLITDEFQALGLPQPVLEKWVSDGNALQAPIIDMGHTCGTTRMSDAPETGVVDLNSQVHGIAGLYVAGSSVFPTSGHANPTLMAVSLAVRLSDHLKKKLARVKAEAA